MNQVIVDLHTSRIIGLLGDHDGEDKITLDGVRLNLSDAEYQKIVENPNRTYCVYWDPMPKVRVHHNNNVKESLEAVLVLVDKIGRDVCAKIMGASVDMTIVALTSMEASTLKANGFKTDSIEKNYPLLHKEHSLEPDTDIRVLCDTMIARYQKICTEVNKVKDEIATLKSEAENDPLAAWQKARQLEGRYVR